MSSSVVYKKYFSPFLRDKNITLQYFKRMGYYTTSTELVTGAKLRFFQENPRDRLVQMTGGKVKFAFAAWKDVHRLMQQDIIQGYQHHTWIQHAFFQEGARFAIDIDTHHKLLTREEIAKLFSILVDTLCSYFPSRKADLKVYCAVRDPVIKIKKSSKVCVSVTQSKDYNMSTGIHFITHVLVTPSQFRQLTHGFRIRAKDAMDLTNVDIDDSILKGNDGDPYVTLRCIFSHKRVRCPRCTGNLHIECVVCNGVSHGVMVNQVYKPFKFYSGGVFNDETSSTFGSVARNYSLISHPSDVQDGFDIPQGEPDAKIEWDTVHQNESTLLNKRCKKAIVVPRAKANDSLYHCVEHFIRNIVDNSTKVWPNIHITGIRFNVSRTIAYIRVCGPGSTFCTNSNITHNSNHIYFTIRAYSKSGSRNALAVIQQRCFSTKREGCKTNILEREILSSRKNHILMATIFGKPYKTANSQSSKNKHWVRAYQALQSQNKKYRI